MTWSRDLSAHPARQAFCRDIRTQWYSWMKLLLQSFNHQLKSMKAYEKRGCCHLMAASLSVFFILMLFFDMRLLQLCHGIVIFTVGIGGIQNINDIELGDPAAHGAGAEQ